MAEVQRRTLIVGYGNPYRGDDGAGYHVLRSLAERLDLTPLSLEEDGLDALGDPVDLVCLPQLLPELAEHLCQYDQVIFVDAHTGALDEDLRDITVEPQYELSAFTHHMKPQSVLALAQAFCATIPAARLISVRGHDFDLGVHLSAQTALLVAQAVSEIERLLRTRAGGDEAG